MIFTKFISNKKIYEEVILTQIPLVKRFLWIGTAFGGLNRFNRETGQFIHYEHDSGNLNSLGDNTITSVYEDKSGVLWVGTYDGISKSDPGKNQFINYMPIPGNLNSISTSFICNSISKRKAEPL